MAMEINSIVLGGNLAQDVTQKQIPSGRTVCTFTVASNHTYLSNNEKKKEVSFIDVEVWGPVAENCAKYLHKGSPVVVMGRLKQERWESQTGEKRSRLKVVAANVQFLPSGNQQNQTVQLPEAGVEPMPEVAWNE